MIDFTLDNGCLSLQEVVHMVGMCLIVDYSKDSVILFFKITLTFFGQYIFRYVWLCMDVHLVGKTLWKIAYEVKQE